jgi:hypothetical protein
VKDKTFVVIWKKTKVFSIVPPLEYTFAGTSAEHSKGEFPGLMRHIL